MAAAGTDLTLNSTVTLATGYAMPRLGFGVYQNYDTTAGTRVALRADYRHIDTAQVYRNEAHVGQALREAEADGEVKREEVFITTKCVSKTHGYESTLKGVKESLDRMQLDYIDLFLIHDPFSGTARRLETYRALLDEQKRGTVRSVGVSNYNIHHMEEIRAQGWPLPSVNQIELHPLCQQKPIVDYCRANGIVVEAYCPLIRGQFDEPAIQAAAKKHSREPAQILIRWSLQRGFVPLPKSATPARIVSNTQVFDFVLDAEDMEALDALDRGKAGAISWNPVDVE